MSTSKMKLKVKKTINPLYGKKGMGYIRNPKQAIKGKAKRTGQNLLVDGMVGFFSLFYYMAKYIFIGIFYFYKFLFYTAPKWIITKISDLINKNKDLDTKEEQSIE